MLISNHHNSQGDIPSDRPFENIHHEENAVADSDSEECADHNTMDDKEPERWTWKQIDEHVPISSSDSDDDFHSDNVLREDIITWAACGARGSP